MQNTLKLHEVLEKEDYFEHYGKYILQDIKERRLESIVQNKEVIKLENKIIHIEDIYK